MIRVLGVTGSIGSGKTTFCALLTGFGAASINADEVGREVLLMPPFRKALISSFGSDISDDSGKIIPSALSIKAFRDEESLKRLTNIVHPEIKRLLDKRISALRNTTGFPLVVLEAPTLFEAKCEGLVDTVATVEAPLTDRKTRCSARKGWDWNELERRERFLLSKEERLERADFIIENNKGMERLKQAAQDLYKECIRQD